MMLDALIKENNIELEQDRVDFIKDLIRGEPRLSIKQYVPFPYPSASRTVPCLALFVASQPPEKKFLFDIVSNKRNGLDVDKVTQYKRSASWTSSND